MRRAKALLLGIVLGSGLVYGGFSQHLVRTADGWLLVPRVEYSLQDAFVDIRQWSLADWRKHPQLTRDMLRAGHGERLMTTAQDGLLNEASRRLGLSQRDSHDQQKR